MYRRLVSITIILSSPKIIVLNSTIPDSEGRGWYSGRRVGRGGPEKKISKKENVLMSNLGYPKSATHLFYSIYLL